MFSISEALFSLEEYLKIIHRLAHELYLIYRLWFQELVGLGDISIYNGTSILLIKINLKVIWYSL